MYSNWSWNRHTIGCIRHLHCAPNPMPAPGTPYIHLDMSHQKPPSVPRTPRISSRKSEKTFPSLPCALQTQENSGRGIQKIIKTMTLLIFRLTLRIVCINSSPTSNLSAETNTVQYCTQCRLRCCIAPVFMSFLTAPNTNPFMFWNRV